LELHVLVLSREHRAHFKSASCSAFAELEQNGLFARDEKHLARLRSSEKRHPTLPYESNMNKYL